MRHHPRLAETPNNFAIIHHLILDMTLVEIWVNLRLLSHRLQNILLQLFRIKEKVMNVSGLLGKLRDSGLRITPLKKQVVKLFMGGACGLSARDVHDRLPGNPHISTVHRCLGSLKRIGFLRPDRSFEGILRYRCSRSFYPDHGHFKCEMCGEIFPVSCKLPDEFIKMVENTCSFQIVNSDFFLDGKCSKCAAVE